VKPFLAILAVALVLPASALARPVDPRPHPPVTGDSLGIALVHARGTDVAAPDQQAPIPPPSVRVAAPRGDGFDWASASIGAAVGIALLTVMLGTTALLRRRRHVAAF
jgi:hypothetical protein